MEKTIEIDGKKVKFKATGVTPLRYKSQFRRDFFADLHKLTMIEKMVLGQLNDEELEKLDSEIIYRMIWVLAKTADNSIPELTKWLDSFDEFPLFDILPEVSELIVSTIRGTKKK